MKLNFIIIATLLSGLSVKANQVTQALQSPHNGDFMFCRSETDPAKLTYLLTLDGEVYSSSSTEKNPAQIQDFAIFAKFKSLKADKNEMFVFTINQKKHKADLVNHIESQDIHLVLTYQDNDNYQSSGYLIKGGQEFEISCFDVTQFLDKNKM